MAAFPIRMENTDVLTMIPVILAGGTGSRLWPLSRSSHPKQFLPLMGDKTMLQTTIERLEGIDGRKAPTIVCNDQHRFLVAEQLRELGIENGGIILEPFGRNTAPAIAAAALAARERNPDELLMVLPADHLMLDTVAFRKAVQTAATAAEDGALATFGIVPTRPETGYGYIGTVKGGGCRGFPISSKSLMPRRPRSVWPREIITGMAACFCSVPIEFSKSWTCGHRRSSRRALPPITREAVIWISPGSIPMLLQTVRIFQSTMP